MCGRLSAVVVFKEAETTEYWGVNFISRSGYSIMLRSIQLRENLNESTARYFNYILGRSL